jgi:hypothetical protein
MLGDNRFPITNMAYYVNKKHAMLKWVLLHILGEDPVWTGKKKESVKKAWGWPVSKFYFFIFFGVRFSLHNPA